MYYIYWTHLSFFEKNLTLYLLPDVSRRKRVKSQKYLKFWNATEFRVYKSGDNIIILYLYPSPPLLPPHLSSIIVVAVIIRGWALPRTPYRCPSWPLDVRPCTSPGIPALGWWLQRRRWRHAKRGKDKPPVVARDYIFCLIWRFYGPKRDILEYWGTIIYYLFSYYILLKDKGL